MIAIDVACNNFSWVSACEKWDLAPNAEQRVFGRPGGAGLSNALRLNWRWLKRAPRRGGQVSASGLAADHSKDDTVSSSRIGPEPVWNSQIMAATPSLPFFLFFKLLEYRAAFCFVVLSSRRPQTWGPRPLLSLSRVLAESWEINALTLGWEELGFGQFWGRLSWIIHPSGEAGSLMPRRRRRWTAEKEYQGFTISQP